jgi:hypothetical protein
MSVPARAVLRPSCSCPCTTQVRRLAFFSPAKAQVQSVTTRTSTIASQAPHLPLEAPRPDANGHGLPLTYFDTSGAQWLASNKEHPDPNKAKLGKTLRILQSRLPTLLQSPLPQEILAPNIALHLFPTTHPHLPTVSGRVAYNAALWTSPIAWNRVPIIGNVKLEILAERMTSEPVTLLPRRPGAIPEQLVVRWCERRKNADGGPEPSGIASSLGLGRGVDPHKAFTGLFYFDFDKEGRILSHTIEQAQETGGWENGMGAKFVGLTDWLLGGMKNPNEGPITMFECIRKRRRH